MKRGITLLCLVLTIESISPGQPSFIRDSLDAFMKRSLAQWRIPGAAIAIVKDGRIVTASGYGVREAGKPDPVDANTLFGIGSNTKAFTATAMAMLQADGRLTLNDKVARWLPEFRVFDTLATRELMIRDLLCHRIGLGEYEGDFVMWGSTYPREEIVRRMRFMKPATSFRSTYAYCNSAFIVAGEIIPRAAGVSWDAFVRDSILTPLGMRRTNTSVTVLEKESNAARPHMLIGGRSVPIRYGNIDNSAPAGAINSSVAEMAHWLLMQTDSGRYNGRPVVPWSALSETRTPQMVVGEPSEYERMSGAVHLKTYGLGWTVMDYAGRLVVRHTGEVDGFISLTCVVPEERLGFVLLTNSLGHEFQWPVFFQVLDAYLDRSSRDWEDEIFAIVSRRNAAAAADEAKRFAVPTQPAALSASLDAYAGTYRHEQYGTVDVRKEEDGLRMHFSAHPSLVGVLTHQSGDRFICTFSDPIFGRSIVPFTVTEGRAVSFVLTVDPWVDPTEYVFTR